MRIMSIRISWDKYETALLIEAALIVIDDNSSRTRIVKKLSSQLRQLAINRGYIIDDVFRNENGIRMQMITIIDILTSTKSGLRNASKLFYEMAELYKLRRDEFDGVLEEAKRMISQPKDVQQDFFLWLSKKVSSKQLSELYITYKAIEEYGKSKKILSDDLFKITDKAIISKLFVSSYGIRKSAIEYYCKFLDEKYPISYEKKESPLISSTELERNIQVIAPSHKIVNNKDERKCAFDFNQVNFLKDTKPIYAIVYVVKISEPYSWLDLYVKLVKKIWKWHKLDLLKYRGKSFTNKTKISMGSNRDFKHMHSPIKITSDVYLETELTLDEIEENIRALKNICSISKSNIKIVYETSETNIDITQDYVSGKAIDTDSNDSIEAEISLSSTNNDTTEKTSKFEELLNVHFRKGFRLSSPIDLKKFKGYYEKSYSESIDLSDDSILLVIKQQGIVYDDKVFLPSSLLNDETKNEIIKYIETEFSRGTESIYYSALFEKFSDAFLDSQIYNDEILKEYLSFINTGLFFIHRSYLTSRSGEADSVTESVKKCLIENGHPMQMDDIYRKLSHLPRSKIKFALASNKEFISNGHNVYFHIKIADIDDKDLRLISNIIENAIAEKDFISGGELYSAIEKKDSIIIEKNPELSVIGLRDAIKYHLEKVFSFNGNIISKRGEQLSMYEVFADFSRNHSSFTLDELTVLKQELGTNIYFEAVYNNSLRISGNDFVSKDRAAFDVEATDKAIEAFCFGDYTSLSDITSFSSFPDAGFAWNTYLLEAYTAAYSKTFCLMHGQYNANNCVGAIVKRVSGIVDYESILIDVIANSNIELKKEKALDLLCERGYIARRSYSNIEKLLIKAKEKRNRKG